MARIERLTVYPVKALDGLSLERAPIRDGGTLAFDRTYALVDAAGDVINAKRTPRVHDLSTDFDPASDVLTVEPPDGDQLTFDLAAGADRAAAWFGSYFHTDVRVLRDTETGFPDRPTMGPSVISTASIEAVASWFEDLTVEGARRRLRANVEVSGVPAFWEDRFVGVDAPSFRAGDVRFEGVTPCGRCVVPSRDPDTGEPLPGFRERFIDRRRATFPDWADPAAFDHDYTLMLIAQVPEADRGTELQVGDPVEVVGT